MFLSQMEDFEYKLLEQWLKDKEKLQKELLNGKISLERKEHLTTALNAMDNLYSNANDAQKQIITLLYHDSYYPEEVADEIGYTISRLNSSKKIIIGQFAVELGWIYPFK